MSGHVVDTCQDTLDREHVDTITEHRRYLKLVLTEQRCEAKTNLSIPD